MIPIRSDSRTPYRRARLSRGALILDPVQWTRICSIFERALEFDAADRPAFMEVACGDDRDVLRILRRMVEADADGANALDLLKADLEARRPSARDDARADMRSRGRSRGGS